VTLLEDDLWDALWAGVRTVAALDVDGRAWPVRWPDARVTHRSYGDLITNVQTQTHMEMRFLSPTTFRAGELDLHLPDPGAVFQSWLSRWNDFAPPRRRIDPDLMDVVRARVAIARIAKLRTQVHDLGRNKIGGFVGRVTFVITRARRLNQAHVWQINALADYAQFCGTGRKTPQGMGQTRRVSRGR
jgi:CRISPR-associated endoribonuclease Cas6